MPLQCRTGWGCSGPARGRQERQCSPLGLCDVCIPAACIPARGGIHSSSAVINSNWDTGQRQRTRKLCMEANRSRQRCRDLLLLSHSPTTPGTFWTNAEFILLMSRGPEAEDPGGRCPHPSTSGADPALTKAGHLSLGLILGGHTHFLRAPQLCVSRIHRAHGVILTQHCNL